MKSIDLFGDERDVPEELQPSAAWVEGWDANMYDGLSINPYTEEEESQEYSDRQAGYDAAEMN